MTKPLPHYLLEQLVQGDLPAEKRAQLQARLAQEPDGAARLSALLASDEALRASLPGADDVRRRLAQQRPRRAPWALALATAGVACVALGVWRAMPVPRDPDETEEHTYAKGPGRLIVRRQTAGAPEQLSNGAAASARDVLQLSYTASDAHGVIFSIDGRGGVTLHSPETPSGSTALLPREDTALPHSFELDNAPGFERFFFVTAAQPIDVEAVLKAGQALAARPAEAARAPLVLPQGLSQNSFLVNKAGR